MKSVHAPSASRHSRLRLTLLAALLISHGTAVLAADVVAWGGGDNGFNNIAGRFTNIVAIATGSANTLALRTDGTVLGWYNGGNTLITVPPEATNVIAIAAGNGHQLALREDGTVIAWGKNADGQANVPPGLSNVVSVAAANRHSMVLKSDGTVVVWGNHSYAQTEVPAGLHGVTAIAAGTTFCLALRADGMVVPWGNAPYGGLGPPADLSNVVAIAAGAETCHAVKADGQVVAWGSTFWTAPPATFTNAVAVALGNSHALGLGTDGRVVAWGSFGGVTKMPAGLSNAVAVSTVADSAVWYSRALIWSTDAVAAPRLISPRRLTTLVDQPFHWRVLAMNGTSGFGADGLPTGLAIDPATGLISGTPSQVGTFEVTLRATNASGMSSLTAILFVNAPLAILTTPLVLRVPPGQKLDNVLAAVNEPTGFAVEGLPEWLSFDPAQARLSGTAPLQIGVFPLTVFTTNQHGVASRALTIVVPEVNGYGDNNRERLDVPLDLTNTLALAVSDNSSLALRADGRVAAWGDVMLPPVDLTNAVSMAAGLKFGHAIRSNGWLVTWGDPPPAMFLNKVAMVSAMNQNSVALRTDGSVRGWGWNVTSGETNPPPGLRNVVAVSAGRNHTLALLADGRVKAWGESPQTAVPPDLTNAVEISAGRYHSLALRADGTVVGWGQDYYGQVTPPDGLSNVVAVSAGRNHSLALRADGSVVHWGHTNEVPNLTNNVAAIRAGYLSGFTLYAGLPDAAPPVILGHSVAVGVAGQPSHYRPFVKFGPARFAATGLPAGLVIDPAAGLITGKPASAGNFDVTLWATNGAGVGRSEVHYYINEPAVSIVSSRIVGVYPGVPFSYTITVENGPADVQVSGLPPWLSFDPVTRTISGLPPFDFTQYSMTIVASNQFGVDQVTIPLNPSTLAGFGESSYGAPSIPADAGHVVAIGASAASYHALAVRSNGTVLAWGRNDYGQTNVPAALGNVVAVAAGRQHSLALRNDGTVSAWGAFSIYGITNVPAGLANVAAIAAGYYASYALRSNGVVTGWGDVPYSGPFAGITDIRAIAAGTYHCVALRSNGTVAQWGSRGVDPQPAGLTNVAAIAAGLDWSYALKSNGTLVRWGWAALFPDPPAHPETIVKVSAGEKHSMVLNEDGTLEAIDSDESLACAQPPPGLSNVMAVACGRGFTLALVATAPTVLRSFPAQVAMTRPLPVLASAVVGAAPLSGQWFRDGDAIDGATNAVLQWPSLSRTNSGLYSVIVSNVFGWATNGATSVRMMPPTRIERASFRHSPASFSFGDPDGVAFTADDLPHFEVHGSTDLLHWSPLSIGLSLESGRIRVDDPSGENASGRFYRVIEK